MTYNKPTPIKFGKLLNYFYKYWDYRSKRNTEHSAIEVVVLTSLISTHLKIDWDTLGWDLEELKWIYHGLDNNYSILDPHNFTDCKFAYLDHLKTCYLEHNE